MRWQTEGFTRLSIASSVTLTSLLHAWEKTSLVFMMRKSQPTQLPSRQSVDTAGRGT
jgi:hypothetical protein